MSHCYKYKETYWEDHNGNLKYCTIEKRPVFVQEQVQEQEQSLDLIQEQEYEFSKSISVTNWSKSPK